MLKNLLNQLTQKEVAKRFNNTPKLRIQKVENLALCFKFLLTENIKLVAIGPEDIVDSNLKLILGLIWILILKYQVTLHQPPKPGITVNNALLEWVRSKIPQHDVKNFTSDWQSGHALYDLVNALEPGTLPEQIASPNATVTCTRAMDAAATTMDIPQILDPQDMVENPDEHSNVTYISYFRNYLSRAKVVEAEPEPVKDSAPHLKATQFGNDVRGDYLLKESFAPKKSDYVSITVPGSPAGKEEYIIKERGNGTHEGSVNFECEDYRPFLHGTPMVLRYCRSNGKIIMESEPWVFYFEMDRPSGGEGLVARLNGLTLQATFTDDGEVIYETNAMDHQEHFMSQFEVDPDEEDDDQECDYDQGDFEEEYDQDGFDDEAGCSWITATFRKKSNYVVIEYYLDESIRTSKRDYVAVALECHDDEDYITCSDASGKQEGRVKVYCDGFEEDMHRQMIVARYYTRKGKLITQSDEAFKYRTPR